jgi:hypothetical protein
MNLAEDPSLIVSDSVIFDGLMCELLFESIDDFDLVKVQDNTRTGTTGNVSDLISLESNLDLMELSNEGYHEMKSRLSPRVEHGPTSFIHTDVP